MATEEHRRFVRGMVALIAFEVLLTVAVILI
jgi:hypothetical protein